MNAVQQLLTDHIDIWTAAETEKRAGRGRASGNATSVYGIKKLRELILEFAVRGKLVPQDSRDEPASELLKRIQIEKAKLIAEGQIKKEKSFDPISSEEIPFQLPHDWKWVRIGQIGHDWGQKIPDCDFTYIEVSAIDNQRGVISSAELVNPENAPSRARKLVKNGTLVYSTIRPYLLNIAVVEEDFFPEPIASTAFAVVHPFCGMPSRYFLFFLRSPVFVRYVESVQMGIAYPAINDRQFFSGLIPLPPLAEQHRIVAKVDELMALCDQLEAQHSDAADAHEQLISQLLGTLTQSQSAADFNTNWARIAAHFDTLFTTETSIDALKQTLLQLAVKGKLVAQDPNDEPASELLKRIQTEKNKLVSEGKIKKDKLLAVIGTDELRYSAPTGWVWVRFNVVAQTRLGKMLDQAKNKGVFRPYLRNTNVQWNRFELDDLKEMRFENHELDEYRLNAGDLVICEGGEPGRSAVWENQLADMFIQKALHRARTWPGVSPYYLNIHLKVDVENGYLEKFFTGATIKHFSGEKLSLYPIALPPASEQIRILARLNQLMTLCNQLRSRITESNQQQKKLADVFVEHATEG